MLVEGSCTSWAIVGSGNILVCYIGKKTEMAKYRGRASFIELTLGSLEPALISIYSYNCRRYYDTLSALKLRPFEEALDYLLTWETDVQKTANDQRWERFQSAMGVGRWASFESAMGEVDQVE